jgi:hypothetical protein
MEARNSKSLMPTEQLQGPQTPMNLSLLCLVLQLEKEEGEGERIIWLCDCINDISY